MEMRGSWPNWACMVVVRSGLVRRSWTKLARAGWQRVSSARTVGTLQTNIPAFQTKLPVRKNSSASSGLGFSRKRTTS